MLEKINAALDVCTIKSGEEKDHNQASPFPKLDITTNGEKPQGYISGHLKHGAENAIKSEVLMHQLGMNDIRHFRELVERERASTVILSNSRGLYLPAEGAAGRTELKKYIKTGTARIAGQSRALRTARELLNTMEIEGQETIKEVGSDSQ